MIRTIDGTEIEETSGGGEDALAILFEHPRWFQPLFEEFDRRGTPYLALRADDHHFDPGSGAVPFRVLFNRMSPSAHIRGHGDAIFYVHHYLAHLERRGVRVINGSDAYRLETSKAMQVSLLSWLGLPHPPARVVHRAEHLLEAARGLRFPVVVKPNVGGSGAGIRRFDAVEGLASAVREGELELGWDRTALVQECIPPEKGRFVRVEVLDGRFLYAIRIYPAAGTFNLCPADICGPQTGELPGPAACPAEATAESFRVEGYTPPPEIIEEVERIARAAGIEVGGVEYVVDARDGRRYYYDVNALSNFVADAPRIVGFDPWPLLVDYLERVRLEAMGSS